jgi:PAS domain S-box-containing protein
MILLRYLLHQRLVSEVGLQYALAQQKEQLKQYSTQLEELVAQRTRELAVSEQKYRGLFDYANDGVAVYDSSGIIVNVNRKFCELHGFPVEALIGTSIKVLDAGKDDAEKDDRFWRILKGESLIYETRHYRKDGETILLEVSAKCLEIEGNIYVQAFHRDISDKKRLQEQLFQSQKMESIGMLAGGLAHDFNNIISAIIGHVDMMNEDDSLSSGAKKHLAIVESSSRRASQMISKLLKFARKGTVDIQPVALNSVVRDTTELIGKTLSHRNVEVKLALDDTIPPLLGDANQMEQVVMNLMVNAADAMPSGGTIKVATTVRKFGHEAAIIHPLLVPGSYVILRVTDSGTGIPDDVKDKIFDPFFTTKEQGKGTGLGLAMVYGIVKEHKGAVTLSTQVGRGTTFEVYIPAAPVAPASQPSESAPKPASGTVMIVDDEEETLRFVRDTVESFGYKVIAVGNAIQALQIFREKSGEIDLVITDIFMPVIDGRDMIRNVKAIKPSVKVLAMSGYQIEEFVRNDIPVDAFLGKPFGGIELMSRVNKLMQPNKSLFS